MPNAHQESEDDEKQGEDREREFDSNEGEKLLRDIIDLTAASNPPPLRSDAEDRPRPEITG